MRQQRPIGYVAYDIACRPLPSLLVKKPPAISPYALGIDTFKTSKAKRRLLPIDHPLCDSDEFGALVRLCPKVVTRKCRARLIKATGKPLRIHIREAGKWGLTEPECLKLLAAIRAPDAPPPSA